MNIPITDLEKEQHNWANEYAFRKITPEEFLEKVGEPEPREILEGQGQKKSFKISKRDIIETKAFLRFMEIKGKAPEIK